MTRLFCFLSGLILLVGCGTQPRVLTQNGPVSAATELINKSIAYHDPRSNWLQVQSTVHINSVITRIGEDTQHSKTTVDLDNKHGVFKVHRVDDQVAFKGAITQDTCYNDILTELSVEDRAQYERLLGCKGATLYKNYYSYLLGIPMKLLDPEAIVNGDILQRTYDGVTYDVVKVQYEPLDSSYVWYFYFDKSTHAMSLCKFTSKEDELSGGEYLLYNGKQSYQDIIFSSEIIWLYNTPTLDTLAVEQLSFN